MDHEPDKGSEVGAVREMRGADLIIPVLAGGFAIYFLASTWHLTWEARINGVLISVPLLTLVAIKIGAILFEAARGRVSLGLGELAAWNDHQFKRLLLVALMIAQIVALPWLGVTLGVFLLLFLSMFVLGVRSKAQLILVPTVTAVAIYLMFVVLLNKRIPLGPVEHGISALMSGAGF